MSPRATSPRAIGRRVRAISTALCLLLSSEFSGPAAANPIDAFGYGARAAAMGGAQTAASEDGGANYYNPALLASFGDIRMDVGYQLAFPSLLVNDLDLNVDDSRGTLLSLIAPGEIKGVGVALGAATFLPDQHLSRIRTLSSDQPRFVAYDNRPQRMFLAATLSVSLAEKLFAGIGVAYMSSTQGTVTLDGRLGFPNADDSDFALDMNVDLKTIRYAQAGLFYRARPWLDIGLSYRGQFSLVLDQVFLIQGDVGAEGVEPLVEDGYFRLRTVSQDLFQPEQITAGLDARLTPNLSVAFDLQLQRWSKFENPAAEITIDLDIGQFNDLIDIPDAPPLPEAGFRDILVPRLGVEWTAMRSRDRDLHLRGGYVYEPSPVPEQIGETNFVDNDKHILSAGVGLTLRNFTEILPRPLSLDAFVAATVLEGRIHRKVSAADAVGSYRSSGHVLQMGLLSRWRF